MEVTKCVQQPVGLAFHRRDDFGMAVANERDPEARCQIDVPVAIGIDDVCALGLDPDDGVVTCSSLFFAPLAPAGERRALACREAFYPGVSRSRRDPASDRRKCVTKFHSGVLARRLSGFA